MPTPDELERMARTAGEIMGAGDTAKTDAAVGKLVTEMRHRNEDLVPGRIVHVIRESGKECVAAIVVQTSVERPTEIGVRIFNPIYGPALPDGFYSRGYTSIEERTWHFSIDCAKVMAR